MSDIIRESSKWARERTKAMMDYNAKHTELFSVVAGRGFVTMPGFLYGMETDLELGIKLKLSDVNYQILSEIIDREMKAAKLSYDMAYKNAQLAWELLKQSLISLWDQEYAHIKEGMSNTEESLAQAHVAVQARSALLMTQKTAIEVAAEGYRTQIASLSDDTADYEVTLAQKKLLTVAKKLELIPILQQIITAEETLILAEQGKMVYETTLSGKLSEVGVKKQELIPIMANLLSEMALLVVATQRKQGFIELQLVEKLNIAQIELEKMDERLIKADNMHELQTIELEISTLKIDIQALRETERLTALTSETTNIGLESAEQLRITNKIISDNLTAYNLYAATRTAFDADLNTDKINKARETALTGTVSDRGAMASQTYYHNLTQTQNAEINSKAQVTATLAHLLSV
jgi:hypothetical protein